MTNDAPQALCGLLAVNKPWGWSSHDVVGAVRRLTHLRAVGHAGTLDPLASGLLLLGLGPATRVLDSAMDLPKCYVAEVRLGATSATDDAEGPLIAQAPLGEHIQQEIETALGAFVGQVEQRPPAFAAIKVGGQAAYQAARRGQDVDLAPRRVTIYRLALLRMRLPNVTLAVWCSRGTYIRALARDLGVRLGCGGYLAGLVRVAVGPFHLREALSIEQIGLLAKQGELGGRLHAPEAALGRRPVLLACGATAGDVRQGRPVPVAGPWGTPEGGAALPSWALGPDGRLLALGEVGAAPDGSGRGGLWRPRRVFAGGGEGL